MTTPHSDLQERLAEVTGRAKNFTGAGGVAIALASGDQFTTFVTNGTSLEIGAVVPIPTSFGGFRKEKGNVLRIPDTDKEATIDIKACRAARIKSMLIVPVGDLSSIRGILAVFASGAHAFTETHVAVLKTLAEVISHLLPEKEKLGGLATEKKADELLEHPFDPAFDPIPKAVKIGGGELADFNQQPVSPLIEPSPPRSSRDTGSIFAGGAVAPKPAPTRSIAVPPLPKPSDLTPSRTTSASFSPPTTVGSVLNLAADPIAEGALVTPKRSREKRASTRSAATTSLYNTAVSPRRSFQFDFRRFYTALIAVVALVATTWGLFEWVAARNARRVAESYVIPPPAASRASTRTRPTNANQPAPVQPTPVQAAPVQAAPVQAAPVQAAPVRPIPMQSTPMNIEVVGTATAANLPERASVPPAKTQSPTVPQKSGESDVLTGQDIVVVSKPSAADLRKLEEESPPTVNVPAGAGSISNVLTTSTAAPTPVLKHSQVVAAVLVSKVAPIYPDQAKRYGLAGKVVVNAKVTKAGAIAEVRPVSGNTILSEAAMSAVRKWRYKPATLDGRPVDSTVELTFDFNSPR